MIAVWCWWGNWASVSICIMIHGFWPHFCWKCPNFRKKTVIFYFSKIHIFDCFLGFWRWNWNSKTSLMIYLTIINAPPVKNKIKNLFWEIHIFTRFNLRICLWIKLWRKKSNSIIKYVKSDLNWKWQWCHNCDTVSQLWHLRKS